MLIVDDAYADQVIALFGAQNLPVRAVPIGGGGGSPGGPAQAVQSNGSGLFAGFGSWRSVPPAFGIGHQQVMRAATSADIATGFLVQTAGGLTRLQATYTDDPNPLSQVVDLGLLSPGANNIIIGGNLNLSALAAGIFNATGFSGYGFTSAGGTFQASAMSLFQFQGDGSPGSLYSVAAVDSATFVGNGSGGGPFSVTGFPLLSAAGTGPGAAVQFSAWESFTAAGTGPGSVWSVSGYQSATISGIGAGSSLDLVGWGALDMTGAGPGTMRSTTGFETVSETGIGTPSSLWEVDNYEVARVRAIGGVEIGPAGASALRITPQTETTKAAGLSLRWDGVGNVYEEASSTAAVGRYALAWVTGSPPIQTVVDLSALGIAAGDRIQIQVEWSVKEPGGAENFCWYWGRAGAVQRAGVWSPVPNFFPASGSGSSAGPAPAALVNGIGSATSIRIDCGVDAAFPSGDGELVVSVVRV